jgi:hypothetical protein
MENMNSALTSGMDAFDLNGLMELSKNYFLVDPLNNNSGLGAAWGASTSSSEFEQLLTLSTQEVGNLSSGFNVYNFPESYATTVEAKGSNLTSEAGVFTMAGTRDRLLFGGISIATVVPDPGNTLGTAYDVGTLSGTRTFTDFVGSTDTSDIYRFSLSGTSNFNLSLTGLSNDADVRLIQDINSNGIIDSNDEIVRSSWGGTHDESINRSLTAGTYFVQVYQYIGDTNYTLNLSTDKPSNLLLTETDAGLLSGTRTFSGSISSMNTSDIYRFSFSATSNINLTLSGLSNDADIRLIQDANNNGIIDSGEEIIRSSWGSNYSEGINSSLGAGNYFVQVYQYNGDTNYNLSLSTGDWYNQNLSDPGIIGQARTFAADGQLSRNDMMAILGDAKDGGIIDSTELTSLRTLLSGRRTWMPDYVYNLSNKIINSDPANTRSGIGNLFAGSTATQMERLIGKWFLGNDRPTASGTYRPVSGSLFQNGISYEDIDQGGVGDCYFLSGLAATAFRSPSTISSMFINNGDNTYTVRFFNNGVVDYVTVDNYLPTNLSGNRIYAGWGGGSNTNSTNELWVALAEKAYAQVNQSGWLGRNNTNSYAGIGWGNSYNTMREITGRNTEGRGIPGQTLFGIPIEQSLLISSFNEGRLITLGTKDFNLSNSHVVADHEYTLVGYNSSTQKFKLFNPWGVDEGANSQFPGLIELTWSELVGNFDYWNRTIA